NSQGSFSGVLLSHPLRERAPRSPTKPNRRSKAHSPANSNRASNIQFSPATYKGRRSAETRRPLEMSSLVCSGGNSSRSRLTDVVLLLPVTDGGADGVFGQHRAVNLHWRQGELLDDVSVRNFERVVHRLALDPLGRQ